MVALILGLSLLAFSCQAAPSTEPTVPAEEETTTEPETTTEETTTEPEATTEEETTTEPETTTEEETTTDTTQTAGGVALPPPHPLEGLNDCLMCPEKGIGGKGKIPDDHTGRTNETCTACHQPAG